MKRILVPFLLIATSACSFLPDRHAGSGSLQSESDRVAEVVSGLRGLTLAEPVRTRGIGEQRAQLDIQAALNRTWDDSSLGAERALKAFTLVPPDMNLREWYGAFLSENAVTLLEPRRNELLVIEERLQDDWTDNDYLEREYLEDGGVGLSLLDADLHAERVGRRIPIEANLALGNGRALAAQNFGWNEDARTAWSDDHRLARASLAQGNAMSGAADYLFDMSGLPMSAASPIPRTFVENVARRIRPELFAENDRIDGFAVPPIIHTYHLFSYIQGSNLTTRIRAEYGWEGVNEALLDPPESSEQVIHPERYIDRRDRPVTIHLPAPPSPWKVTHEGTLGMLGVDIMLRALLDQEAGEAAEGWDGDRYAVWETPIGDALGWVTVWDYEHQAKRFEWVYRSLLNHRFGQDSKWAIVRRDDMVAVVQGAPMGEADNALSHLLEQTRLERAPDDIPPERWYWTAAKWPVAVELHRKSWETHLLGGYALDFRSHDDGHRFRLLHSLLLHTENNPDRTAAWLGLGLIGFTNDDSLDYSFARIPILFNWHGRGEAAERRSRFSMVLRAIDYQNRYGHKSFDLIGGALLKVDWGVGTQSGDRLRILFIPIPGV